uniref:CA domain-containing protein n=1 Tax=Macrostomum lignano TaxID=282301 RepID=A0A1I8I6H9_9PLAT
VATDIDGQNASLRLIVNVTDVNDNRPQFHPTGHRTVRVRESDPAGNCPVQLSATDPDSGENGRVIFELDPHQPDLAAVDANFRVSPSSGFICHRRSLDYETKEIFELSVIARNPTPIRGDPGAGGAGSRLATATVTVLVVDENDEAPQLQLDYLDGTAEVTENDRRGHTLAALQATDRDRGDNGRVSCQIDQPDLRDVFELLPTAGSASAGASSGQPQRWRFYLGTRDGGPGLDREAHLKLGPMAAHREVVRLN